MRIKKECSHKYIATAKKSKWKVRVMKTHNRENFSTQEVTTTVFKCLSCNAIKEFPDIWERNYIAPENTSRESTKAKRSLQNQDDKRKRLTV